MEANEMYAGKFYMSSVYGRLIDAHPLLSREEELELVKLMHKYKSGHRREDARTKLVNSNIRLVAKEASHYSKHSALVAVEDLMGAGVGGLCIAIDRFNPKKYKTKLSTYAVPWIKLKILRALADANASVYVPRHILEQSRKYRKTHDADATLTDADLMKELNVTEQGLRNIRLAQGHVISLSECRYTEDEETTVGDVIPDAKVITSEKILETKETKEVVFKEVAKLDSIASEVITRRFLSETKEDLGDIGKSLDLTGERVRQIEFKALKVLRKRMKNRAFFGV